MLAETRRENIEIQRKILEKFLKSRFPLVEKLKRWKILYRQGKQDEAWLFLPNLIFFWVFDICINSPERSKWFAGKADIEIRLYKIAAEGG